MSADDRSRFWELPFDPGDFDALPMGFLDVPADVDPERERVRSEVLDGLAQLVRTSLTDKQRQIVELYFYEGRALSSAERAWGNLWYWTRVDLHPCFAGSTPEKRENRPAIGSAEPAHLDPVRVHRADEVDDATEVRLLIVVHGPVAPVGA